MLHDLTLDIRAGELLALLGPSGSGKTTLLRIIAGLDRPDAGRILFGRDDATHVPVQQRAVGFVFQHYALFKHMTVADNIAYGLNARKRAPRPAAIDGPARSCSRAWKFSGSEAAGAHERPPPGNLS